MRSSRLNIAILLLALVPSAAGARDAPAIWDSRCEECHGESARFAGKFLWAIDGQLQGRHHVNDLPLFMHNHYIPEHEIEPIRNLLLAQANSSARFDTECGACHGGAQQFVAASIRVTGSGVTGLESGMDVSEFLPTHRELQSADVSFYQQLFARVAGKPLP